uniref:Uncharacterized protein n=1 Tax=Arion vulgaris TaxID=1028688 RepID=A0A0B7A1L2_9EUPU
MLALSTDTECIMGRIPKVKMIPNSVALALSKPDEVPSDSGNVNSAANSKPTGR